MRAAPLPVPWEDDEQIMLVQWATLQSRNTPELALLYHIPNAGSKHIAFARNQKAMGLKPGVPDLCLPVARGGCHGLYVELKRRSGGTVGVHQKAWHERLRAEGYRVVVAYGWEDARAAILEYLRGEKPA